MKKAIFTTLFLLLAITCPASSVAALELLTNGTFDADTSGWTANPTIAGWDNTRDAEGVAGHGSAVVPALQGTCTTLTQCVPAIGAPGYVISSQALVEAGSGTGHVFVAAKTYASNDCTTGFIQGANTFGGPLPTPAETWSTGPFIGDVLFNGTGAQSIQLEAKVCADAGGSTVKVNFDDLSIRTAPVAEVPALSPVGLLVLGAALALAALALLRR